MAEALGTVGGYVAPVGSGYSDPRDDGGSAGVVTRPISYGGTGRPGRMMLY